VLTICIEPTLEFNERSGMASSTRRRAIELWQMDLPKDDRHKLARILFSYENPPGTVQFSGSQDSIGIVFPGLNRLDYRGAFWPAKITSVDNEDVLTWLQQHLRLVLLGPRKSEFDVFKGKRITPGRVRSLAVAADACWQAILKRDLEAFGCQFRASFEAQVGLFPAMSSRKVRATIRQYAGAALGWKLSGAGGGGYLVLVTKDELPGAIKLKIRRPDR
jgi:galactokinase/mevalonate kinase-like predicted kinase